MIKILLVIVDDDMNDFSQGSLKSGTDYLSDKMVSNTNQFFELVRYQLGNSVSVRQLAPGTKCQMDPNGVTHKQAQIRRYVTSFSCTVGMRHSENGNTLR